MLDTQQKIKIIMILLPILVVGLIIGLYMKDEAKRAEEVEYARIEMEKREQAGRDYAKSMEPTAEQRARNKIMDSLSAERKRNDSIWAVEYEKFRLDTVDTKTAADKK
jgi:hypothetical protein